MAQSGMLMTWPCPRCDEKPLIRVHAESTGTVFDEDGNATGVQLKMVVDDATPAAEHLLDAHGIDVTKGETP